MKNRLKVVRAECNFTQASLAERVKVSRQTINAIEVGKYNPTTPLALKIAEVCHVTVEAIFQLQEEDWK